MSLKRIPEEAMEPIREGLKNIQNAGVKMGKKVRSTLHQKLKQQEIEKDMKVLADTAREIGSFLKQGSKHTLERMNDLTHLLQRSILSLQKKKQNTIKKTASRKK